MAWRARGTLAYDRRGVAFFLKRTFEILILMIMLNMLLAIIMDGPRASILP